VLHDERTDLVGVREWAHVARTLHHADVRVRQALAMGFERRPIVKNITRMGEEPATNYIPPGIIPDFDPQPGFDFDVKRARALLTESGKVVNGRLPGVTLMYRSGSLASAALCQHIVAQLFRAEGEPVHHGHGKIEQDQARVMPARLRERIESVLRGNDREAGGREREFEESSTIEVVVDDQDERRVFHAGRRRRRRSARGRRRSIRYCCYHPDDLDGPVARFHRLVP